MRTLILIALTAFIGCDTSTETNSTDDNWCDRIYHQNVSCPKFGEVEVPPEVLAEQEARHLAWCDDIYHRNVSCPKHGEVEVPLEVLVEEEAHHLEWCDSIDHRNVGCPDYSN